MKFSKIQRMEMHHKIQFEQSVLFIMVKVLQNSAGFAFIL